MKQYFLKANILRLPQPESLEGRAPPRPMISNVNETSRKNFIRVCAAAIISASITGCFAPVEGPDKQFVGTLQGAASGAGAGAVAGFQMSAGAGPGAAVGAGFGALAGAVQGLVQDVTEEEQMRIAAETRGAREVARAHAVLEDHYRRRLALHPSRDIFPADVFFDGDEARLRPGARALVVEIARLSKRHKPWAQLIVASYVRGSEHAERADDGYAERLAVRRAEAIGDELVRAGLEPRRILGRGVTIDAPLVLDPDDSSGRYNQAVELIFDQGAAAQQDGADAQNSAESRASDSNQAAS